MNVSYAATALRGAEHHIFILKNPILRMCHGVHGNFSKIFFIRQVIERLRRRLLVQREVVNGASHGLQVGFQGCFSRSLYRTVVATHSHADQNKDDRDYDHQLDERESALFSSVHELHHSV